MNKAIAHLAPLFYLPTEVPVFEDYMLQQQFSERKQQQQQQQQQQPPLERKQQQQPPLKTPSFMSSVAGRSFMSVSEELDERQKMALYFSESKARRLQLKEAGHRLTYADIDGILSDLITYPRQEASTTCFGLVWVDLTICIACAQFYHRNIVVADAEKKTFVRFLGGDTDQTVYFLLDASRRKLVPTVYVNTEEWFSLWDFRKPLRAISHYKIDELTALVHTLPYVGALQRTSTRQELYTAVEHYCYGLTVV